MRKTITRVALVLFALGGAAHAQRPAPSVTPQPPVAAPPSESAAPGAPPAPASPVPAQPPSSAPGSDLTPPSAAPVHLEMQSPEHVRAERRVVLGLSLLPMGLGKFNGALGGTPFSADAALSYGVALRIGYVVVPGVTIAFAPQGFLNVKPKDQDGAGAREYDFMARLEYALPLVDTITVFVDVLPGYSLIVPPHGDMAKGLVLGIGGGAAIPLSERLFADLDVGYQVGFQSLPAAELNAETRTRYVRVALGIGARF